MDNAMVNLRELLYLEVKDIEESLIKREEYSVKLDLLNQLNNSLSKYKIQNLLNDYISVVCQLDCILDDEAKKYSDILFGQLHLIKTYSGNSMMIKEYNAAIKAISDLKKSLRDKELGFEIKLDTLNKKCDKEKLIEYRRILSNFRFDQKINHNQLDIISKLLDEKGIDSKRTIKVFEYIKMRNTRINQNCQANYYYNQSNKYEIVNMMDMGYEVFPTIDVRPSIKTRISNEISSLYQLWDDSNKSINVIPTFNESNYSKNDYKAFYYAFMNMIQNKIYDQIEAISDKDFYFDKSIKIEVINEYHKLLLLYKTSRKFFEEQLDMMDYEGIIDEKIEEEIKPNNHLIFLNRGGNGTYFEKDLDSIPEEYLDTVIELLDGKKNDILNGRQDKAITNNIKLKHIKELKTDQIRIVYRHLVDNYYCILGGFAKKTDCDSESLRIIASRYSNITNEDMSNYIDDEDEVYQRIIDMCQQNKRKRIR